MIKEDCIFCKIANGQIPSSTVYEDHYFRVILDLNPASKGHCLILTKEHFDNIFDMDAEVAGKLFSLASMMAKVLRSALPCDGLNVVQNNGEVAGQTVNHFHLHLIPRYDGDDVKLMWTPHTSDPEEQEELRKAIKAAI